jgi:hypothetical protein
MCALKSRGMSAVCTWGLRGICFLTLVLFVLISHSASCALLCGSPLSYACTHRAISKTPNFMLKYELCAYAYATYDHLPCAKAKRKVLVPRRIV